MNRFARISILAASTMLATAAHAQDFDGVEIKTQELSDSVAVLFGAGGNIAVAHGDDATLMIDDQFAPLSDKIAAAIAALDADPVEYLVNTHWHGDHTGGNENFGNAGATIFAQDNVRMRLQSGGTVGGEEVPPAPRAALPIVTYPQGLRIHLNGDTISLMYFGGGHTDGDTVVFFEEDNIVHVADLYFNIDGYPFIDTSSGGSVYSAMTSLDAVLGMIDDETQVIPGHGPVSNKAELAEYRARMGVAVERVDALRAAGMTLEEATATKPLADMNREGGYISADRFVYAIWNSAKD